MPVHGPDDRRPWRERNRGDDGPGIRGGQARLHKCRRRWPWSRPRQATTDMQGAFEFTGVAAGTYRIQASPSQYAPQYLGDGLRRDEADWARLDGHRTAHSAGRGPVVRQGGHRAAARRGHHRTRHRRECRAHRASPGLYPLLYARQRARHADGFRQSDQQVGQFRVYGLQTRAGPPSRPRPCATTGSRTNAPPETEEEKIGFVTTYYPGTPVKGRRSACAPASARRRRGLKSGWRRVVFTGSPAASSIHRASHCLMSTAR